MRRPLAASAHTVTAAPFTRAARPENHPFGRRGACLLGSISFLDGTKQFSGGLGAEKAACCCAPHRRDDLRAPRRGGHAAADLPIAAPSAGPPGRHNGVLGGSRPGVQQLLAASTGISAGSGRPSDPRAPPGCRTHYGSRFSRSSSRTGQPGVGHLNEAAREGQGKAEAEEEDEEATQGEGRAAAPLAPAAGSPTEDRPHQSGRLIGSG
jgi:hypothetical protein